MTMSISDLDNICYKHNFIKQVIFRIDFSPILQLRDEISSKFQEQIRKEYLTFETETIDALTTGLRQGKEFVEREKILIFNFLNKDRSQKVTVSFDHFIYQSFAYHKFEEFRKEISETFNAFKLVYSPLDFRRIGLRFINEINLKEGNPFEWNGLISNPLISVYENFSIDHKDLSRAMSQFILNRENYYVNINYGIFNSEFPARISRKEFILDYDCYSTETEESRIIEQIDTFHSEIQKLFESSIGNELRKIMEIENA